ncbi:hypothetical protein CHS0354_029553 [Potamilus streckersoni]|uniref:LRAT domain-containing protein n=1 Tax=Potamilus streckersoni TaxID=2493646 RepID=A0AAE0VIR9_9BIVA|nr:hypothetical protein CHS0354_029553 [Potamilus streckersoni]
MSEGDPFMQGDSLGNDDYGAIDNIGQDQVQETIRDDNISTSQHSVADSDNRTGVHHSQSAEQDNVTEAKCHCFKREKRVRSLDDLNRGDHIVYPVKSPCCKLFFSHHAIFVSIVEQGVTKKAKLLHFYPSKKKPIESDIDLRCQQREVYKIVYENQLFTGAAVEERARKVIDSRRKYYSYCNNNCEHFCVEAVTGKSKSSQIRDCVEKSACICCGIPFRILRIILAFTSVIPDDISQIGDENNNTKSVIIGIELKYVYRGVKGVVAGSVNVA